MRAKPSKTPVARWTRWVRRLALPIVLVALFFLYRAYGMQTVPKGMDTMLATYPPGTICLIQKNPSSLKAKRSVVFLRAPGGGMLLSRVDSIQADGSFEIRHDNRQSRFLQYERQGPYSLDDVRGLVLSGFSPDPPKDGKGKDQGKGEGRDEGKGKAKDGR